MFHIAALTTPLAIFPIPGRLTFWIPVSIPRLISFGGTTGFRRTGRKTGRINWRRRFDNLLGLFGQRGSRWSQRWQSRAIKRTTLIIEGPLGIPLLHHTAIFRVRRRRKFDQMFPSKPVPRGGQRAMQIVKDCRCIVSRGHWSMALPKQRGVGFPTWPASYVAGSRRCVANAQHIQSPHFALCASSLFKASEPFEHTPSTRSNRDWAPSQRPIKISGDI